MSASSKLVGLE